MEITAQQAAKILKVSRLFLLSLVEKGQIPFQKTRGGSYFLLEDLVAYRKKMEATREESLRFLAQQAQELNLGYNNE